MDNFYGEKYARDVKISTLTGTHNYLKIFYFFNFLPQKTKKLPLKVLKGHEEN